MRISELSEASGVPIPTIKYYLREGLLPSGDAVHATRADYGDAHVRRLAVIRALVDVAGLPIARARDVLTLIDEPGDDLYATVGLAVGALPPYQERRAAYPLAQAAIARLGWAWDPRFTGVAQLERALEAVSAAGLPVTEERLDAYAAAVHAIAESDVALAPTEPHEFLEYAVVGTALYEPVLLALRRLALQDVSGRALGRRG